MSDNILKKEFNKKDVERLRNLVKGKSNERTSQGIGYTKKQEFYKEGDVWEENGRKWTIKNGIKQNVTKMDRAKKAYLKPLLCPKCNKVMNKGADPGYYNQFGHCFKCFKKFETYMIANGLWDDFVRKTRNGNIDTFIKWYKEFVNESLNQTNAGFVTEAGDVENWNGGFNKSKVIEALNETVKIWEEAKN